MRQATGRSTKHVVGERVRGKSRKPGTVRQITLEQGRGLQLLPVTSGMHECRIEVRREKTSTNRDKLHVRIILKDLINGLVLV